MDKFKIIDREFWIYFRKCLNDSEKEWLAHFEGWKKITEPIWVGTISAIVSVTYQKFFKGVLEMSDAKIIIYSALTAPIVYFLIVYLLKLVFAPFRIFLKQMEDLSAFNWDKIHFEICEYEHFMGDGWGIRVTNKKKHDILLVLEMDYLRNKEDFTSPKRTRRFLGNIVENREKVKENIIPGSNKATLIQSGEGKIFPLTILSEGKWSFLTFPEDDSDLPFPSSRSSSLITVMGGREDGDRIINFPDEKVEISVSPDGRIRPLDKKNEFWK